MGGGEDRHGDGHRDRDQHIGIEVEVGGERHRDRDQHTDTEVEVGER